jgi:Fe-S-cluster-containing dehydrogenase component
VPNFDREKCVHCGACLWNCASASPESSERMSVTFRADIVPDPLQTPEPVALLAR